MRALTLPRRLFGAIRPALGLFMAFLAFSVTAAPPHRAVFLGNPDTRFAEPLHSVDDLRRVFQAPALREDIARVARMSGYLGDMEDFHRAVRDAEIRELAIPPGTLLPAMSTRKKGAPTLLFDVLWAGKQPIQAYEFQVDSLGRRYRVVVPRPCSNFWVEERPLPRFTLACAAPASVWVDRPFEVCLPLGNIGAAAEPGAVLNLFWPAGVRAESLPEGAEATAGGLRWRLPDMPPDARARPCATLVSTRRGELEFSAELEGTRIPAAARTCGARVNGIPAVLLEVIDAQDPIQTGTDVVYEIRVLNQGSEPLTRLRLTGTLEDSQRFVSGDGVTPVTGSERQFAPEPLARLEPGAEVSWRIRVRAEQAGDVRMRTELVIDQFARPVIETEATLQY